MFLADNPEAGDVMPGTGGVRKVRWIDQRRGKGRRGGRGTEGATDLASATEAIVATTQKPKKRKLFAELMEGVSAMRAHREGRITARSHRVEPLSLPSLDRHAIRRTREHLHMSRQAFAHRIGVNPRTLERWEQGRSKPNDQAVALILLVRKYPDTLKRLELLASAAGT
jgi:putative transcriptional regulator